MGRASSASSSDASVPGKRTLTEQLPAAEESDIVRRVAVRAGAKVTDRGNFGYVITAEGAFEIVSAPPQFAHTVGNTITMRGAFRTAWVTLATIALETPSSDSTSEQCTEPEDGMSMLPAPAPAPAPAPDEGMSIGAPSPSTGAPGAGGGEAVAGDLRWCSDNEAILRDETGAELVPRQLVPRKAHVRVLETRAWKRAQLAKVERVDASGASTLLGWTAVSNLHELQRPKRPSDPGKQMADLLQRSKGGGENGRCFAALKMYIRDIGGYGDILDIQTDERFEGYQESGYQFADAIRSLGAAAFGLEEVGGLPADAAPGTILVTRGNAKATAISAVHGDVAVISHLERGLVIAYNYGRMELIAKASAWAEGGNYQDMLVGMFRPVARGK